MAEGSRAKRHHHVPRFYLARWGDRLAIRWRDGKSHVSPPHDVAVIGGFYDLRDERGEVSVDVERFLGDEVEAPAAAALAALDESGRLPPPGTEHHRALTTLIAFQMTRTPELRARMMMPESVREFLGDRKLTLALMAEYLDTVHLGFVPSEREVKAAFSLISYQLYNLDAGAEEDVMRVMYSTAVSLIPKLTEMHWTLAVDRKQRIITSDEPVRLWKRPERRRWYEGVGVATADEIRFPIDPGRVLILRQSQRPASVRLSSEQVGAFNSDLAVACHRFVVGASGQERLLQGLPLATRSPAVRFDIGPAVTEDENGRLVESGEVLNVWTEYV